MNICVVFAKSVFIYFSENVKIMWLESLINNFYVTDCMQKERLNMWCKGILINYENKRWKNLKKRY